MTLEADPRYYQRELGREAWRDPWVVQDAAGAWHMYVTARDARRARLRRGRPRDVGGPPRLGGGTATERATGCFDRLEMIQVVQVEGRWVLLFSCLSTEMPGAAAGSGGVWSVPVDGPGTPVDVASAVRVTDERSYVGKVVHDLGTAYFMAFRNQGPDGQFVGGVTDPIRSPGARTGGTALTARSVRCPSVVPP